MGCVTSKSAAQAPVAAQSGQTPTLLQAAEGKPVVTEASTAEASPEATQSAQQTEAEAAIELDEAPKVTGCCWVDPAAVESAVVEESRDASTTEAVAEAEAAPETQPEGSTQVESEPVVESGSTTQVCPMWSSRKADERDAVQPAEQQTEESAAQPSDAQTAVEGEHAAEDVQIEGESKARMCDCYGEEAPQADAEVSAQPEAERAAGEAVEGEQASVEEVAESKTQVCGWFAPAAPVVEEQKDSTAEQPAEADKVEGAAEGEKQAEAAVSKRAFDDVAEWFGWRSKPAAGETEAPQAQVDATAQA